MQHSRKNKWHIQKTEATDKYLGTETTSIRAEAKQQSFHVRNILLYIKPTSFFQTQHLDRHTRNFSGSRFTLIKSKIIHKNHDRKATYAGPAEIHRRFNLKTQSQFPVILTPCRQF